MDSGTRATKTMNALVAVHNIMELNSLNTATI